MTGFWVALDAWMAGCLSEKSVLEPLKASIQEDTSQWPEFSLKSTRVFSQATGNLSSLLSAHEDSPVRVEGILEEIDLSQKDLIRVPKYRHKPISITDVATYSFSQFEDGSFGFWAAGKAGWFEVKDPAKIYKQVYSDMMEATSIFYFLADKCRSGRRSFTNATVKEIDNHVKQLCNAYLLMPSCTRKDQDGARGAFYKHRDFLIKSMLEGQEGLVWRTSSIYQHLKHKFTEDFATAQTIVDRAQTYSESEVPRSQTHNAAATATKKSLENNSRRNGKAVPVPSTPTMTSEPLSDDTELDSVDSGPKSRKRKARSVLRPKSSKSAKKAMRRRSNVDEAHNVEEHDTSDNAEEKNYHVRKGDIAKHPSPMLPAAQGQISESKAHPKARTKKPGDLECMGEPLPSFYETRGLTDTWKCPYSVCNVTYQHAKSTQSIERIKNHFVNAHASNAEDLVNQELRPWISADHLLDRIKSIASLKSKMIPEKPGFPAKIFKRY